MAALYHKKTAPLHALIGGRLTRVEVSRIEAGKPDSQMEAFAQMTRKMMGDQWQGDDGELARICQKALLALPNRFSLLLRARAIAMALSGAGLEGQNMIPHNKRRRLERCIRMVKKLIREDKES